MNATRLLTASATSLGMLILTAALAMGPSTHAQVPVALTQSIDNQNVPFGTVCTDMRVYRSYPVSDFNAGGGAIEITGVRLGIRHHGGNNVVEVRIYEDTTPGHPAPLSDLVLLHSDTFPVTIVQNAVYDIQFAQGVPVPASAAEIVIEMFIPTSIQGGGTGLATNSAGETAPTYASCNGSQPLTLSQLGLSNRMGVLDLVGIVHPECAGTEILDDIEQVVFFDDGMGGGPQAQEGYVLAPSLGDIISIRSSSPGGALVNRPLLVVAELHANGMLPASPFPGICISGTSSTVLVNAGPFQEILLPGGHTYGFPTPTALAGTSMTSQAIVLAPSPLADNGIFASSHGIQIVFP